MSGRRNDGFSWSASRHGMFTSCERQYFFHYYLATGRTVDRPDPRRSEAFRLRSMTSLPLWVGSSVHDTVENLLRDAIAGGEASVPAAVDRMVKRMRRDYADSVADLARRRGDPKAYTRFVEHEHAIDVPDEEWKRRVEEACAMVRFFGEVYLPRFRELERESILGLERLENLPLDGVPVWVKIDCAYEDGDGIVHILDWKTGVDDRGDDPLQMRVYALFAVERWGAVAEQLDVREVYLRRGDDADKPCRIDDDAIDETREQITASIAAMRARLDDVENNLAREERFEPSPSEGRCRTCFFRSLCTAAWSDR